MNLSNIAGRFLAPRADENLAVWKGEKRGHYEVWYLTFNAPADRVAFWLRYTLDAPDHGEPYAELWGHFFDGKDPDKRFGLRKRVPRSDFEVGGGDILRIGEARLGEHGASGALEGSGHTLSWDLTHDGCPTAFFMFPSVLRGLLVRKRTNWGVPNIDVRFRGKVEVDGRTFALNGAPGQQAHLAGHKHADSWTWLHCNTFDHGRTALVELVAPRVPGTDRVLTTVYLRYEGRDYLCNALPGAGLFNRSERSFPEFRFWARSGALEFVGHARANPAQCLQVKYEDPDGAKSYCSNSELSDLSLEVKKWGRPIDRLTATGTAHLEFADRQQRLGVPLCPGP